MALLGVVSCQTQTLRGQRHASYAALAPLHKVAVAPFALGARFAADADAHTTPAHTAPRAAAHASIATPRVAAQLVARQLAEALARRGVEVVAPGDVAHALADVQPARGKDPRVLAQLVAREFGADALLTGTLTRWSPREGGEFGATRGAAVGFETALHGAPGAARLWSLTFDERQKPAGDNVLVARGYPGGGLRWVSAEEWARWSAGRVARAVPLH